MKAIQQSREADNLDQWKSARDSGAIKTASSGLKRDADSSRMGSAGLFAERADAKMPYIDRGYVQETTSDGIPIKKKQESAPAAQPEFAGFQNPFEKKESAPAPAPAPAPAAPEHRTRRRLLRQAQGFQNRSRRPSTRGAEPVPGLRPCSAATSSEFRNAYGDVRVDGASEAPPRRRRDARTANLALVKLDTYPSPPRACLVTRRPWRRAPRSLAHGRNHKVVGANATEEAAGLISVSPSLPEKWDS